MQHDMSLLDGGSDYLFISYLHFIMCVAPTEKKRVVLMHLDGDLGQEEELTRKRP